MPCALSAELLAGFFGNLARQPTPSRATNRRDIAAPLAADRQQATQRVQACKETLALAGSRVAYRIPYLEQLQRIPKQLFENLWRHLTHLLDYSLAKSLTWSN
jgi:hypothetical protein